jgi:hypothetical protein
MSWRFTLPTTLAAGPYALSCAPSGTPSNTVTINVVPTITQYGPTPVVIGQPQVITILGSGFGAQGQGYVDLLPSGMGFDIPVKQVISWSPNQIQLQMPSSLFAGQYQLAVETIQSTSGGQKTSQEESAPVSFSAIAPAPPSQTQQPWVSVVEAGPWAALGAQESALFTPPAVFTPASGAVVCDPASGTTPAKMYCNFPVAASPAPTSTIFVTDRTWQIPVQIAFQDDGTFWKICCAGEWVLGQFPFVTGSYSQSSTDLNDPILVGNKAHFDIAVGEFADCAIQPPSGQPAPQSCTTVPPAPSPCPPTENPTACQPGPAPQGIACPPNGIFSGPDGSWGCWVPIGTGGTVSDDLFGPSATGVPSAKQAAADSIVTETLQVPVHFLHVVQPNFITVEVSGYIGDTRVWPETNGSPNSGNDTFATGVTWNPGAIYNCTGPCGIVGNTHPSDGQYSFTFNLNSAEEVPSPPAYGSAAFEVQVLPVAIEQLRAVPDTITYQPPGNNSWAKVTTSVTQGTSYSIGGGTLANQGTTSSTQQCNNFNNGVMLNASVSVGLGAGVSVGGSTPFIGVSVSGSSCTGAQESTVTSQSAQSIETESNSTTTGETLDTPYVPAQNASPDPIASLTPGPTGQYVDEPFWYDIFWMNLGQPYLIYTDAGIPALRLLPTPGWPDTVGVTLAQIAACANSVSVQLPLPYGTASNNPPGETIPESQVCQLGDYPDGTVVTLTPAEANQLLTLDPFYPNGQSTNLTQVVGPGGAQRAAQLQTCADIEGGCPQPSSGVSNVATASQQNVATVTAGLTNFQVFSQQNTLSLFGNTLSAGGQGTSNSFSINSGTTSSTAISYSTSTAMTQANTITWAVQLSDNRATPLTSTSGTPLDVLLFQDNVFGTPMFEDPNAAPKPAGFDFRNGVATVLQQMASRFAQLHPAEMNGAQPCSPWPSCIFTRQGESDTQQASSCPPTNLTPAVASVEPATGSYRGGFTVLVRGTGFCGATSVTAGGWKAKSFTVLSDTELRAILPGLPSTTTIPQSGYSVDVAVCTRAGCSPQYVPGNFKYLAK